MQKKIRLPTLHLRDEFKLYWTYKYVHLLYGFWWRILKHKSPFPQIQYTILSIANVDVTLTLPDFMCMLKEWRRNREVT